MLNTHRFPILLIALFSSGAVLASTEYVCAARVDCGTPRIPSTQDLPSIRTPVVSSETVDGAKDMCLTQYTGAYYRLTRSLTLKDSLFKEVKSCQILSDALPL